MSLPNNPIDFITSFITSDLASVLGQSTRSKNTMRKQRLYTFHVDTPNFGNAEAINGCTWKYIVATQPYTDREGMPSVLVKIGSDVPTPMGAGLSSIQVSSQHSARVQAVIEFERDTLTLIDLGNEPGTRLNGARVSKIRVNSLDRIQLGHVDREQTTIRYVGFTDIQLTDNDNPQPFVERSPIASSVAKSPTPIKCGSPASPNPFMQSTQGVLAVTNERSSDAAKSLSEVLSTMPPTQYHPIVIGKPTMKKPRSHDRKPLQFNHAPSRERAPISITYPQLYHAIRLAAQIGEATVQTRKPAMDALSAFLIGLNVTPADFLPKEDQS